MNCDDIIRMALEAGLHVEVEDILSDDFQYTFICNDEDLERFAELVAAVERNKLAQWMIQHSYATGHGDTTEDLLKELEWQIRESEREACARMAEAFHQHGYDFTGDLELHDAIRARGQV